MGAKSVRLATLVVAASLVGASCSTSGPTPATKAKHLHHVSHHLAAPATTTTTTDAGTGDTGSGNSGSGNSGSGNTGSGNTGSAGSSSTTVSSSSTTVAGHTVITKNGKIRFISSGPVISKFKPLSSPTGGTVIIYGRRLSHASLVSFDGLPATITRDTGSRIRAVVPVGATSGPISVVTAGGVASVPGFLVL